MIGLFMLAVLAVVGLSVAAILGFVFFLLKIVLWVVFFPLRLLFKLIWLPIGLAFGAVGMGLGLAALPLLFLVLGGVLVFGVIAAIISLMIPAIPFVLLGLLLWSIFRRSPATA